MEIKLKKISYEDLQKKTIAMQIENQALRGCLENCQIQIKSIAEFAENNDFVGDMLIAGTANNVLSQINYILTRKKSDSKNTITLKTKFKE